MSTTAQTDVIPDDLITMSAAAKLAGAHLATVHRWRLTGRLRAWKRVGRYLVSRAELLGLFRPVEGKPVATPAPTAQTTADWEREKAAILKRARLA